MTEDTSNETAADSLSIWKEVKTLGQELLGPACKKLEDGAGSELAHWKGRNLLAIFKRAKEIIEEKELDGKTKAFPEKFLPRLIENASMETEGPIQDMWANLIANACNPKKQQNLKKVLFSLIAELEPLDLQVLVHLMDEVAHSQDQDFLGSIIGIDYMLFDSTKPDVNFPQLEISLSNLIRLQLVSKQDIGYCSHILKGKFGSNPISEGFKLKTFRLTNLGHGLVAACT